MRERRPGRGPRGPRPVCPLPKDGTTLDTGDTRENRVMSNPGLCQAHLPLTNDPRNQSDPSVAPVTLETLIVTVDPA